MPEQDLNARLAELEKLLEQSEAYAQELYRERDEKLKAKRQPNPRDLKFQKVVDNYNHLDDVGNPAPGTVRFAWRECKAAWRGLLTALWRWCKMIPCRLWWHSIPKNGTSHYGIKVCRRCGSWRES